MAASEDQDVEPCSRRDRQCSSNAICRNGVAKAFLDVASIDHPPMASHRRGSTRDKILQYKATSSHALAAGGR